MVNISQQKSYKSTGNYLCKRKQRNVKRTAFPVNVSLIKKSQKTFKRFQINQDKVKVKRCVLSPFLNAPGLDIARSLQGNLFHTVGAATANALSP